MTLAPSSSPASILVVDDDRRVVELLTIALNAYGYRVIQASDGEEALRLVTRERPDLVVLDVRLPKRSGYEVCEMLRQDPDDPQLPIIMVSAAAETEARLQGLARGADDYVSKPFSPKELIARIRRLLTRSAESREARRRSREAEHELGQAREEAKRSHAELRGQLRLRELADAFARDFHASLDGDALTRRLLIETQAHLGTGMAALLGPDEGTDVFRATAVRGEIIERLQHLRLAPKGEMAGLLSGLGRPVRRRDLDRFPELRTELQAFVVAGIAVFAPLRGPEGLVGVVVADERLDGAEVDPARLEALGVLCEIASLALRNAGHATMQSEALLDTLDAWASRERQPDTSAACEEAAQWLSPCFESLPSSIARNVMRAVRIAEWSDAPAGHRALAAMVARDGSGRVSQLAQLVEAARAPESTLAEDADLEFETAIALTRLGLAYVRTRGLQGSREEAMHLALESGAAAAHPVLDRLRPAAPDAGADPSTAFRSL